MAVPGAGKPHVTSADRLRKHKGDGDSHEDVQRSQSYGWWSITSGINPCGRNHPFGGEDGLGSGLKSADGEATVGLGNIGLQWETLPGSNTSISRGDERTQDLTDALARAEALAR